MENEIERLTRRNAELEKAINRKTVTDRMTRGEIEKSVAERYEEPLEHLQGEVARLTARLANEQRKVSAAITDMQEPSKCRICQYSWDEKACAEARHIAAVNGVSCFCWRGPCAENRPRDEEEAESHE